jgi:xanthine/CO dehydrogenase XdhC/CoxF family maturation factor
MKELREIVKAYDAAVAEGRRVALASVVHVDGSSYRRAGARMLVDDEGHMTGAISGGCLEGDALRKAQLVIAQQHPRLVTYDTSDEEDISIGVQLGCAGVIHVLFEPIGELDPIVLLRKVAGARQDNVLVTLYNANRNARQYGTCMLLQGNGEWVSQAPDALKARLEKDAEAVLEAGTSAYHQYELDGETLTAFIEFIPPAVALMVVGAGNDAIPLVNIGTELGWDVSVVDGRGTHARPERFAAACQVLVSKPEAVLDRITIDPYTVFVLMTHNYNYDLAMLRALLQRQVRYIGVLGPRKKLQRMLDELREGGMMLTDEMLRNVYGPVGLEIGAETSEEIALSIIAEIKAVLHQKPGTSLRDKKDTIHAGHTL